MAVGIGLRGVSISMRLCNSLRYWVGGTLHEYLGPARLPGESTLALVEESEVDRVVTKSRIGGGYADSHRWLRPRWE